jgi:hypothetical protein
MTTTSPWANYGSTPVDPTTGKATTAPNTDGTVFRDYLAATGGSKVLANVPALLRPPTNPTVPPYTPTNTNPYGSPTGSSSGGGGGFQPDYSGYQNWAAAAQPKDYTFTPGTYKDATWTPWTNFQSVSWTPSDYGAYNYTPLNLPQYNAPKFYDFDPGQYDQAREGINTGISDALMQGNTAFDRSAQMYQNYQDPFAGGPRTQNYSADPRLMASMEAWGGAGQGAMAETQGEGLQADRAMGGVYDLLSRVGAQYNQAQMAGVEGDRMQMQQGLASQKNMLTLGVNMALARAKAQYQKDLFQYGKDEADKRYDMAVMQAMTNNQGVNNAAQVNAQGMTQNNQFNAQGRNSTNMFNAQGINSMNQYNNQGQNTTNLANNQGQNAMSMYNNQGLNQVNQTNTAQNNTWNQSQLQAILDMINNNGKNIPTSPTGIMR